MWSRVLHRFYVFSVQSNTTLQCHRKAHTSHFFMSHMFIVHVHPFLCVLSLSLPVWREPHSSTCTSHFNLIFFHFCFECCLSVPSPFQRFLRKDPPTPQKYISIYSQTCYPSRMWWITLWVHCFCVSLFVWMTECAVACYNIILD